VKDGSDHLEPKFYTSARCGIMFRMHRLALAALLLAGCLGAQTRQCDNGATCPYDEACTEVPVESGAPLCGSPRLVDACAQADELAHCDFTSSGAQDGTCLGHLCTQCTSVDQTGCDAAGWQKMTVPTNLLLTGVSAPSRSVAFVVGDKRTVLRYTGASWSTSEVEDLAPATVFAGVWAASPSSAFAAAVSGDIVEYAGDAWHKVFTAPMTLRSIAGSGTTVVAVGLASTVARFDGTWSSQQLSPTVLLNGVWVGDADNAVAVGAQGLIFRYKAGTWSVDRPAQGGEPALYAVWGRSPDELWAVGDRLTPAAPNILHYTAGSWTRVTPSNVSAAILTGVWGTAEHVFATGYSGALLHFDGTAWKQVNFTSDPRFNAIAGSGADNVISVGENGTVVRYTGRD
jgi:hypothetical protein